MQATHSSESQRSSAYNATVFLRDLHITDGCKYGHEGILKTLLLSTPQLQLSIQADEQDIRKRDNSLLHKGANIGKQHSEVEP